MQVFALHDIYLIFEQNKDQNGPRDVVRAWAGDKHFSKRTPVIAFCRNMTEEVFARSITAALMLDWDLEVDPGQLSNILRLLTRDFASLDALRF